MMATLPRRTGARICVSMLIGGAGIVLMLVAGRPVIVRADDNGDRINGRKLFLKNNCYICHGGRGGGGMCPSLRRDPPDEGDVEDAVLNGTRSGMPSFRTFVTSSDIRDLAAYIQSLRTPNEPTFTHWWEAVPSQ